MKTRNVEIGVGRTSLNFPNSNVSCPSLTFSGRSKGFLQSEVGFADFVIERLHAKEVREEWGRTKVARWIQRLQPESSLTLTRLVATRILRKEPNALLRRIRIRGS